MFFGPPCIFEIITSMNFYQHLHGRFLSLCVAQRCRIEGVSVVVSRVQVVGVGVDGVVVTEERTRVATAQTSRRRCSR